EPTTLLLHFAAGEGAADIDLLLLRPQAAIVGALRAYRGPIVAGPGGPWSYRDSGEAIREPRGHTPTQHVKAQRDAVRERLDAAAGWLFGLAPQARPFERMVGALICVPATHPESRITLEVSEHRQQIKVLGFDELAQLAAILQTGAQLSD